ncbi:hypothetical protein [Streptomyces sp. Amel2xC10]|uniref:hypothetical protein n=1 Tax=Streptomyces sp. Amel2xC10 TaxID=1305826 RepID=UPI000A087D27|nr:hypothetical protein [Streptomyces sp. Amel2xC10]SMF85705.1 hypothetical protein SAMN02745830_07032 [Streptomyces sp. Amel2xC10]
MREKSLIKNANPVPDTADKGLSPRAADELATLIGSPEATFSTVARRPARRGLFVAAVACAAAVVIGGGLFALQGDPAGPNSDAAVPSSSRAEPGQSDGGGTITDEPYYDSTAELEGAASLIVRARLGAGHEKSADGVSTTVATAQVTAIAKGETPGDSIRVSYTTPGTGPETAGLSAGKEYVLLLAGSEDGSYFLVNTTQGWYTVEDGTAVAGRDNGVALSPAVRKALGLSPHPA